MALISRAREVRQSSCASRISHGFGTERPGIALRSAKDSAEEQIVTRILIIATAALIAEVFVALLAGRLLGHVSKLDDSAEKGILFPRQNSAGTAFSVQSIPESRNLK
jgi:hypothetical protein